jgi:hypothetical protein
MQFTSNTRTIAAAVMLVLATVAVGGAGALTVDTETTDTTTTSDLTDTSILTEPRNDSVAQHIEVEGDTNTQNSALTNPEEAFTLQFVVNDSSAEQDGEVLYESNETWGVETVSSNPDYYNTTVNNSEWGESLQYTPAENVTIDARVIFNMSETDESMENITFTVDPAGTSGFLFLGDDEQEVAAQSGWLASAQSYLPSALGGGNQSDAAKISDSVAVDENTSMLTMSVGNASAQDAFAEVGSASAGSFSTIGFAKVNGQLVPMFSQSADVGWVNDTAAYATASEDGSEVVIHNADQTWDSSTSSVDVVAVGNDGIGFSRTTDIMSSYGAGTLDTYLTAAGAIDGGDPFEV